MKRTSTWTIAASIVALAGVALKCNSLIGNTALTSEGSQCAAYCQQIMSQCPYDGGDGAQWEYESTDVCMKTCAVNYNAWMETAQSANAQGSDNSALYCRQTALTAAGPNACAIAGPLGGTLEAGCVAAPTDPCTTFCQLDLQVCTGQNQQYYDVNDCLSYCNDDGGGGGYPYLPLASGNGNTLHDTLNCRFYHLQNAITDSTQVHCPHTSPTAPHLTDAGNPVCVGAPFADVQDASGE